MEISQRINNVLKNSELTVKEFVKKIEVTEQTFYNYTSGRSKPSSDILEKIVKSFDISPSWLLIGEGEMLDKGEKNLSMYHNGDGDGSNTNNTFHVGNNAGEYEKELRHMRELLAEKERIIQEKDKRIALMERLLDKS